ncbi:MAG: hypothetical protein F4X22_03920 [Gemmatimonadales bacterium]|nr:hypothetical protein [Candidatus Palauibacter denitrificans]
MGTIPGSRLQIGGTSTIDVAGYFNDPDGDELSYMGASSNEAVATVAMEGSTATISAIAAGDAVITITASDGSASVSQGFRIDVPDGPEQATLVITRLLDEDRNQISDPTGISGTIFAVLDVQSNDETWTEIALTLNGETVTPMCRGTGGSSADVAVGPGLAAAGQVEVECRLQTNAVVGECMGMQLEPKYANGEYTLSAYLTTDEDERRDVVASQPIALKNHGFVQLAHMPGSASEVGTHTKGLTFHGGPNAEGNVNMFHACPVAYDGTVVGTMQLTTRHTDTARPNPAPVEGATTLRFRESRFGPDYPVKEAPFTWRAGTEWWNPNLGLENMPGETETWIVNDGSITDPNGRDVSATFRAGGEEAKLGPLHFDFKAPAAAEGAEVVIATSNSPTHSSWVSTTARYYRPSGGSVARRFRIKGMTEMGVGHVYGTTSMIAVGDCSVAGNRDSRASTAFTALDGYDNITLVSQLDEEDPILNGVADGGGVDCYVAEVQSLADRLGNPTGMSNRRIRTATTFGVDKTGPVISRLRPSEPLVLNEAALRFDVENPPIATGEDGSPMDTEVQVRAGATSGSNVYWTTTADVDGETVEINIDPTTGTDVWGNNYFGREIEHTVYARAFDEVGNTSGWVSFTFTRDHTDPVLSLSAVPSNFGATTAKSVSVTVAGTLSDATEIRRSFLSIHKGASCTATSEAMASTQVSGPVRRLHNGTNAIEFSEVFTVKQGGDVGEQSYCFFLTAEDDARDADDRADANTYSDQVATFSVMWPAGPPAPPPGPTFEFVPIDATDQTEGDAITELEVTEGSTTAMVYAVKLANVATAPTATAPVNVTITAPAGVNVIPQTVTFPRTATDGTTASDTAHVSVTTEHDLDITSNEDAVTHSATGYDAASLTVKSNDDDFEITVDTESIREDEAAEEVTVTVTAGTAPSATDATTVTVALGYPTDDAETTPAAPTEVAVEIAAGMTSGEAKVMVDALDDAVRDEANEAIELTVSGSNPAGVYYKPDRIMIMDDDPDIDLSVTVDNVATSEVGEGAGTVTVVITATADAPVNGTVNLALAVTGTATGAGTDYTITETTPVPITINARGTTGTATLTLTIVDDAAAVDAADETIVFDDADGAAAGGKTYTVKALTLTIKDNDS